MKTTLNQIRAHSPCQSGWRKLLAHLSKTQADDEPLPLLTVLESNGLNDTLWCLRAVDGHDREKRLLAVAFASQLRHLMRDPRSRAALDVAERYANGEATDEDLKAAEAAARAAADAAAWSAAEAAARAAAADADAARSAAAAWAAAAARDAGASDADMERMLREILTANT